MMVWKDTSGMSFLNDPCKKSVLQDSSGIISLGLCIFDDLSEMISLRRSIWNDTSGITSLNDPFDMIFFYELFETL